ncbi:MAG: GH42, partial [uncultured Nocardioidaceae bacterium]
ARPAAARAVRCRVLPRVPAGAPPRAGPRPHGGGRLLGDPRRGVHLDHLGAGGRTARPRLVAAGARRRARARDQHDPRHPDLRRPAVARPEVPGDRRRARDRAADPLGGPAGGRLHPPGVPVPRRADRARRGRTVRRPPRRHRLPGGQRAGPGAAAQPRPLRVLRRPPATHLRRRRDAQPGVGPGLLVAPLDHVARPLDARRQLRSPVRPRLASFPGPPHQRLHRLADADRARVRPRGPVRHHLPGLHAPGDRRPGPHRTARHHRGQPLLRHAGRPRAPVGARGAAGLDDLGSLERAAERGPDVLLEAGAVPGHRDQRGRHRRPGSQLPGVRRAVATGRVGDGRPWCPDGRVLALAHAPLRDRDLLGGDPAARPAARPGLRPARRARRRAPEGWRRRRGAHPRRAGRTAVVERVEVGSDLPAVPVARLGAGRAVLRAHRRGVLPRRLRRRRRGPGPARRPGQRWCSRRDGRWWPRAPRRRRQRDERRRPLRSRPGAGRTRAARAARPGPVRRDRRPARLAPRLRRGRRTPGARTAHGVRRPRGTGPARAQAGPAGRGSRHRLPGVQQPGRAGARARHGLGRGSGAGPAGRCLRDRVGGLPGAAGRRGAGHLRPPPPGPVARGGDRHEGKRARDHGGHRARRRVRAVVAHLARPAGSGPLACARRAAPHRAVGHLRRRAATAVRAQLVVGAHDRRDARRGHRPARRDGARSRGPHRARGVGRARPGRGL